MKMFFSVILSLTLACIVMHSHLKEESNTQKWSCPCVPWCWTVFCSTQQSMRCSKKTFTASIYSLIPTVRVSLAFLSIKLIIHTVQLSIWIIWFGNIFLNRLFSFFERAWSWMDLKVSSITTENRMLILFWNGFCELRPLRIEGFMLQAIHLKLIIIC